MREGTAKDKSVRYRGTSTLEAAFVLVILLMITLGIMGFGWFFLRVQQVTNAARHGARIAIRFKSNYPDVQQGVDGLLSPVGLTYTGPIVDDIDPGTGQPVKVTVTGTGLDILNLDEGGIFSIPDLDDFSASVTMAKEGP